MLSASFQHCRVSVGRSTAKEKRVVTGLVRGPNRAAKEFVR